MVPDVNTVLSWRAIVRALLRVVGLFALPAGLFFFAAWIIEGTHDGDLWNIRYYYWRIISGSLCVIWGVMGLALAGPISRVILPLPSRRWPPRCPYCRHELVSLREARCPECGGRLPTEFLGASQPPAGAATPNRVSAESPGASS